MNKKYLLLAKNSQDNKKEIENVELPVTFSGNGHRLRNYRIYGNTVNGESVGDLVTEGEHTGEYSVSVTISSNLFDGTFIHRSVIGNSVSSDDPNRRSIVIDISNFNNGDKITFSRETGVGSTFQMYQVNSPLKGGELLNSNVFLGNSETLLATITLDNIANYHYLMIFLNGATQPITDEELLASKIMINVGDTALPYEPYHEPITTNIYLTEPLRKIGDEAEYIDFREQKRYPSGDMISLPAIPTIDGTNIITVDTETQPSKIYIQGNIEEIETVLAETQALQTNMQSLQTLSLDENAELDVMPSDNLQLTSDFETTGDDENAE